jgi:hypothetical protein
MGFFRGFYPDPLEADRIGAISKDEILRPFALRMIPLG